MNELTDWTDETDSGATMSETDHDNEEEEVAANVPAAAAMGGGWPGWWSGSDSGDNDNSGDDNDNDDDDDDDDGDDDDDNHEQDDMNYEGIFYGGCLGISTGYDDITESRKGIASLENNEKGLQEEALDELLLFLDAKMSESQIPRVQLFRLKLTAGYHDDNGYYGGSGPKRVTHEEQEEAGMDFQHQVTFWRQQPIDNKKFMQAMKRVDGTVALKNKDSMSRVDFERDRVTFAFFVRNPNWNCYFQIVCIDNPYTPSDCVEIMVLRCHTTCGFDAWLDRKMRSKDIRIVDYDNDWLQQVAESDAEGSSDDELGGPRELRNIFDPNSDTSHPNFFGTHCWVCGKFKEMTVLGAL